MTQAEFVLQGITNDVVVGFIIGMILTFGIVVLREYKKTK